MLEEAPKSSVLYLVARSVAIQAANQFPPTYHCADFEPHEWVIQAIADGIAHSGTYHSLMSEIYQELNQLTPPSPIE